MALVLWEKVLVAKGAQGVLGIHLAGVFEGRLKGHLVWFKALLWRTNINIVTWLRGKTSTRECSKKCVKVKE